ncbi:MAG TPA: MIP/aquaporin family protein [Nakamurella sp.]
MSKDAVVEVGTQEELHPTVGRVIIGEVVGSFLIAFLGLGIGFTATTWSSPTSSYFAGIWPTVFGWAFAIAMAIYVSATLSGAHFNPAITLAMAATGRHPWRLVPLYIACQFVGWFLGAAVLVAIFKPAMELKAAEMGVDFFSERIGSMLTSYSPNPGFAGTAGFETHTFWTGFAVEAICTGILVVMVLSTGANQVNKPPDWAGALIIGTVVGMLIMFAAPISQASFNPARDLGPRFMLLLMGFGDMALPGTGVWYWSVLATTIGPIVGAVIAAVVFDKVVLPRLPKTPVAAVV